MAQFSGGPKVGHKMKLYRNAGTRAVPVWSEISEVGDVTLDGFERGTAELKRRTSDWTKECLALFNAFSVNFKLIHGLGLTMFDNLRRDYLSGARHTFAITNAAITDPESQGLEWAGHIKSFPWNQPLEEVSDHDIVIGHAYMEEAGVEIDPWWIVGGSSSS